MFNYEQYIKISASFSSLGFTSPKYAQIINYFVQSCDCIIAAFRNSVQMKYEVWSTQVYYNTKTQKTLMQVQQYAITQAHKYLSTQL